MVSYRRNFIPGGTYFFTVTLNDRRARHLTEHIDALRQAFRTTRRERPFDVVAIAVLPDHLHAILILPTGNADFSGRWRRIKSLFTRALVARDVPLARTGKGEYNLWQRRFWEHTIRDLTDLERHVDYIHFNPVRHGLVARALDWPYSSFRRYVRMGLLPADWGGGPAVLVGDFGEPLS
ncbi:MAG: transposase [Betaproteobacteria bacterium]|nr:transposase [Betaproteobacteria bacterium]